MVVINKVVKDIGNCSNKDKQTKKQKEGWRKEKPKN